MGDRPAGRGSLDRKSDPSMSVTSSQREPTLGSQTSKGQEQ